METWARVAAVEVARSELGASFGERAGVLPVGLAAGGQEQVRTSPHPSVLCAAPSVQPDTVSTSLSADISLTGTFGPVLSSEFYTYKANRLLKRHQTLG